ncbi:MAG: O-antigen ligase family protein [Oscillospiraceae bacterium]|nr:O-antigen ligase family protein [Oscillospiraceae bacterium]
MRNQHSRNVCSAITSLYLAALLCLYLLYPGQGYQSITVQKWQLYLWLTGIYAAAALLARLELALVGAAPLPSPRGLGSALSPPHWLFLGYLLVTALSAALSEHRPTALWGSVRCEGLAAITLYVVSFLLVSAYARPRRWMLWLFAAAISVNCVICLIQFAGYNPLHLYPEGMNYYGAYKQYAGEFLGTIGNVDILSAVLSLSIPAFCAALLRGKGDRLRFLLPAPMILCLIVLLKAFVAGGVLGVGGALVLSAPLLCEGKTARKRAALGVACGIVLFAVAVYAFGGRMGGFLYEASELMRGRWDDDFGSGRLYIWRNALALVPEHPLFGGGPDTLGLRTDAAFERYDEALGILIHSSIDTAHNEYLNILVNQGAAALALYLAALIASAVRWVRRCADEPVTAVCGCAILGYCIQAFFGISSPISTPYFWMALALLNPMRHSTEPSTGIKRRSK